MVSSAEQLSNRQDQSELNDALEVKQYSKMRIEVAGCRDSGVNRTVSKKAHV